MTRPKDGSYIPDSDRWPGLRKRTPLPTYRSGQLQSEGLMVVQSYKGFALVTCRKPECGAVMVYEIADEDTIWSCDGCAMQAFQAVYTYPARPCFRDVAVQDDHRKAA